MNNRSLSDRFFIGWDVGGWNCDRNKKSRDAIVILDSRLSPIGKPWRGNLRTVINESSDTQTFLQKLFTLCASQYPGPTQVTLAIDTPLGFSEQFVALVTGYRHTEPLEHSGNNPYLFRRTERYLFERGLRPLSAVKDMIGSQATKGMHVLAKFAPRTECCGIWSDGQLLTAIEAYPAACKSSRLLRELAKRFAPLGHEDKDDALTCALMAYLFGEKREVLLAPDQNVPLSEGWIWLPNDAVQT
jgi:hypothetical protein